MRSAPTPVGRYAPSPTGALHLGNIRTALLAWLHSRALGARHLLRFEDLDTGRVRAWAYDMTRRDLEWLGLDWDAEYRQSERLELYAAALAQLETYPCTCTRRDIQAAVEASAGAPHGAELVYPGTCRPEFGRPEFSRPASGRPEAEHPGAECPLPSGSPRPAAQRWRVPPQEVCVSDRLSGELLCQFLPAEVGDPVLLRGDGAYAYHLAVVVDDAALGVTDVVRGADLWPATPRQVALQQALGYPQPAYWHVPLMTDYRGERLAKRGGAPSLRDLREGGTVPPERVLADLARSLGWEVPPQVRAAELLPLWRTYAGLEPRAGQA
ncbi:glutamyl-Q tRNA(Asp) synthetase [Deinococcus piscis]|uniref:Glutamyl-Q tRNA(Asp) synthetase n=1 Tax=Deinococcus piscis TaxID=394230 RepID=A0ABQ3K8Q7_9DEIO|nr:tRNA glutamyl-Q(34) synthetase GluQRS [Deinococcus piscis]GHG05852.1 glutamyl-Q tRNA(Asp) synthetase [Deinococcus piscis]